MVISLFKLSLSDASLSNVESESLPVSCQCGSESEALTKSESTAVSRLQGPLHGRAALAAGSGCCGRRCPAWAAAPGRTKVASADESRFCSVPAAAVPPSRGCGPPTVTVTLGLRVGGGPGIAAAGGLPAAGARGH